MKLQLDVFYELRWKATLFEEEVELGNVIQVQIAPGFSFIIP